MNLLPLLLQITLFTTTMSIQITPSKTASNPLAIATRLHLGHATHPPPTSQLTETLASFRNMARVANADYAVVAVDCEERIGGYDLVDEVRRICNGLNQSGGDCGEKNCCTADTSTDVDTLQATIAAKQTQIEILPVTPWGKFVPALNAIVAWAARRNVRYLMLASAEVQLSGGVVERMKRALDLEKTLVVGESRN
jgi:hypothetical protein